MKLNQILNIHTGLTQLNIDVTDIVLKWNIQKTLDNIKPEVERYEQFKNDLVKTHGTEENGNYTIAPNTPEYDIVVKELSNLQEEEVDIAIPLISVEKLKDVKISHEVFVAITPILTD